MRPWSRVVEQPRRQVSYGALWEILLTGSRDLFSDNVDGGSKSFSWN